MSIRIMTQVWATPLPDSEKLVLLALADCANDDGVCWPSIRVLVAKCSKSDRTIQAAIKSLSAAGHLTREERLGKGVLYTIHPRPEASSPPKPVRPEAASPPKPATETPEAASGKPSGTTIPKRASPSSGKRATSMPVNFQPSMSGKTLAVVDGWPPGRLDDELEHFADHHAAKGTTSFDWQASWRTWVKNSNKWEPRNGKQPQHARRNGNGFLDAIIDDERADRARSCV